MAIAPRKPWSLPVAQLLRQTRQRSGEFGAITEGQRASVDLNRDSLYRRALAAADVLTVGAALLTAVALVGDDRLRLAALVIVPFVVLAGKVAGLYDRDELLLRKTTLEETPALIQVSTLMILVFWLGEEAFVDGTLGKGQILGAWALLGVALVAGRATARRVAGSVAPPERCLIVGAETIAERIARKVGSSRSFNAEVVGRVPIEPESSARNSNGVRVVSVLRDLEHVLDEQRIDRVIIAPGTIDSDHVLALIRLVKALGVKVSVVPRLFEVVGSSVEFDDIDGATLLGVRRYGLTKSSWYLKRALDLTGAALGLVLCAPLFAVCALAIKLDSPGPVFFRQARIGRRGVVFQMFKFRTMTDRAEEERERLRALNERDGLFKISEDPRRTRVGRWLRRSCVDELPQLINVLRGEMSLVGPRPLVAEEAEQVPEALRRHEGTPGMTGIWQICGSNDIPLQEMVNMDYLYRANWSLWLDVKLLLRTVPYVLQRRGL